MKELLEQVRVDLGKGRLIQASEGLSAALQNLETRVASLEAKDREANCICKVQDANGEFEIIKRLQTSDDRQVSYIEVGGMSKEQLKLGLEEINEEINSAKSKRTTKK